MVWPAWHLSMFVMLFHDHVVYIILYTVFPNAVLLPKKSCKQRLGLLAQHRSSLIGRAMMGVHENIGPSDIADDFAKCLMICSQSSDILSDSQENFSLTFKLKCVTTFFKMSDDFLKITRHIVWWARKNFSNIVMRTHFSEICMKEWQFSYKITWKCLEAILSWPQCTAYEKHNYKNS